MNIVVDGFEYELITNYRDSFKEEDFKGRYAEILNKYDYIVGDWGYGQLRLKGFFEDKNQKASFDTKISTLADYLYEYCNFGCAYFVLKKIGKVVVEAPVEEVIKNTVEEVPAKAQQAVQQDVQQAAPEAVVSTPTEQAVVRDAVEASSTEQL